LIAVGGIISAIAYVVFMPLVILHPTVWGTVVVGVAALVALARYSQNRPKPESMASFGAPLWGLIGSKLVPHAIGTGEDPFRLQALQAPRK
jgi:hypothetical protein